MRHILVSPHDDLLEILLAADFGTRHGRMREQPLRVMLGTRTFGVDPFEIDSLLGRADRLPSHFSGCQV